MDACTAAAQSASDGSELQAPTGRSARYPAAGGGLFDGGEIGAVGAAVALGDAVAAAVALGLTGAGVAVDPGVGCGDGEGVQCNRGVHTPVGWF